MSSHLEALQPVLDETIGPEAESVDREGRFPARAIAQLGEAGVLGLLSAADVGGRGLGPRQAAEVIERIAQRCGSTAMVVTMHYCAVALIEKHGLEETRRRVASGDGLATLAFSEAGSRSHFWAPVSTAKRVADGIQLDAKKSWITSANHADVYVWSSRPTEADGMSTLWLVPRELEEITPGKRFDGLGLRGNDSTTCRAEGALIPEKNRLGEDGNGFQLMMEVVLPVFNVLNSACSVGLMEGAVSRTIAHATHTRYEHLGSALAEQPTTRQHLSRMRCKADQASSVLETTLRAMEEGAEDVVLRVLESKAVCNEAATEVCDLAMRVCGGAAFRKDVGVERYFRDARAGMVMAPTSDALHDFIGRAMCGMDLF